MSALRPLAASLRCGDGVLEVAGDSGGSESLTLVLVFTPKAAAFEVVAEGIASLRFSDF